MAATGNFSFLRETTFYDITSPFISSSRDKISRRDFHPFYIFLDFYRFHGRNRFSISIFLISTISPLAMVKLGFLSVCFSSHDENLSLKSWVDKWINNLNHTLLKVWQCNHHTIPVISGADSEDCLEWKYSAW